MIQIYSHAAAGPQIWKNNYDNENFWPTINNSKIWVVDQFIDRLRNNNPHPEHRFEILPYTQESKNGYYLIFYGNARQILEHHGMAFLTPEIITRVNKGELKILMAFVHETFDTGISMREWFWSFGNIMTQIGIKRNHSIVFLTSTKISHKLHNDDRCDYIYYPWFEFDLLSSFKASGIDQPLVNPSEKQKLFINLNLQPRQHRFLMVMYLYYKKLVSDGYISWHNPPSRSNWNEILSGGGFEDHGLGFRGQLRNITASPLYYFITTFRKLPNLSLDGIDSNIGDGTFKKTWVGADEYFKKAWVDLVSETHCELYGDVFLTEKTFKSMAFGLPFIYNASQWHLKEVKNLGYQSFPELFDESYDEMSSSVDKIMRVGNEINMLCSDPNKQEILKSQSVQEKILYNQNLFWKKDHYTELYQLLNQQLQIGRA